MVCGKVGLEGLVIESRSEDELKYHNEMAAKDTIPMIHVDPVAWILKTVDCTTKAKEP